MKTADYRRALQETLRWGDLSFSAAEALRCIAIVHNNDEVAVRLSTKAFNRHRWRPGPKRDPERDKRIRDAVIWARFNRRAIGRERAITLGAERCGLPRNLFERAYRGKNSTISELIRRKLNDHQPSKENDND